MSSTLSFCHLHTAETVVGLCRQINDGRKHTTNLTSALHIAYTTPGEPGSFGGVCLPFVQRFCRNEAEHYLCTEEAYAMHKQVKRCFSCDKMLSKGIAGLYQADLVAMSGIANYLHRHLYQESLVDTVA